MGHDVFVLAWTAKGRIWALYMLGWRSGCVFPVFILLHSSPYSPVLSTDSQWGLTMRLETGFCNGSRYVTPFSPSLAGGSPSP